jgi:hypothetical protein
VELVKKFQQNGPTVYTVGPFSFLARTKWPLAFVIVTSFPLDVVLVPNNPDEVEPEGEG